MLKLAVENDTSDEVLEFRLVKNSSGELVLESDDWSILGLRLVDGKVNLVRYLSINDKNFNTNSDGQLEEVDE